MVTVHRVNLEDNIDEIKRYCLSFIAEGAEEELDTVSDHESAINAFTQIIDENLAIFDQLVEDINSVTLFMKYIEHYEEIIEKMQEGNECIFKVVKSALAWLKHDVKYTDKLLADTNTQLERKLAKREEIKKFSLERDQLKHGLVPLSFALERAAKAVEDHRRDMRNYDKRELEIECSKQKTVELKEKKQNEFDEAEKEFKERKANFPARYKYLQAIMDERKAEIPKIDDEISRWTRVYEDFLEEKAKSGSKTEILYREHEEANAMLEDMMSKMEQKERSLLQSEEDYSIAERKVAALKIIRELKLDETTQKKIFSYGYIPGKFLDIKGETRGFA